MKRKITFIILFAPGYYLVTVVLLQYFWFNYNATVDTSILEKLLHGLAFLISVPVLIPFILSDLGEFWPVWLQALPFLLNGLIWGTAILLIPAGIKRRLRKKDKLEASPPAG